MRFLILTQYFPPEIGAAQTRLAAIARELARLGHRVEIVTTMPSHLTGSTHESYRGLFYLHQTWQGMDLHRCWSYAATGTGVRRLFNYISFTLTSLVGLFKAQRADFIFVESPPLSLCIPAWIASRFRFGNASRKSAIIFNVADLWPSSVEDLGILRDGVFLRLAKALERWAYRRARYVSSVTEGIRATLAAKGVPEEKLLFFPNGVDTEVFAPRDPDTGLIEELRLGGKKIVLYAGTHGIAQGLETLIEAARLLREEPFAFLFVGDGGKKTALEVLAKQHGLTNVRFVRAQPLAEMPRYFSIAEASVVPLLRLELFKSARPSKIFPSLASGVPVIYCGEGEAAALLTSADAGIVVEPESAQGLAAAIRLLAADPERRERISRHARALAVSQFAWPSIVERWLGALDRASQPQLQTAASHISNVRGKRVGISGLPFFVDALFGNGSEVATGWKHRTLLFNNRLEGLMALFDLTRSDVWYSMGSTLDGRACEMVASMMRIPRVIHWLGSDIAKMRSNPALIHRLSQPHVVHLAETEWNAAELRAIGFKPQIAPLPPTLVAREVTQLPARFTVLLYVPEIRSEFYGSAMYERIVEDFKNEPVRFLIVGGGSFTVPSLGTSSPCSVENLGWRSNLEAVYQDATVLLRMTERDGLSLMVLEALSFGRYVLWPHNFPFVTNVDSYPAVKAALNRLLEEHRAGELAPQYAAAAYVNKTYDPERCLQRIAEYWTASLPHDRKARAHASSAA